ncbi:MAG TPA: potassium channel protein, partial [Calditrichaeota bacterium]|nr:potassium channel protein [Calditrichota bacterium]
MQTVYQEFKQKLSYILEHPTVRALIILFSITVTAAVLVEIFESRYNNQFQNIWDSVWWVLVTITTVGYGDKIPVTPAGKVLGILVMMVGIAALSVVTATLSSVLVTRKIREGKGLQELKLKDHILLCGWNEQAQEILTTFEQEGHTKDTIVLINQLAEENVTDILARYPLLKVKFVRGDFTREGILNRANAQNAKAAIIVPDESVLSGKPGDERTILATLSL